MKWNLWKKNNSKELVTVLLPTYNRSTWLRESIESILNQTYENIELLVVDDSTTDEIEKICKEYDGKIRFFHRENTSGLASAFNFCIDNMKGEWLKIMASDDIMPTHAIETFVNHAHKTNSKVLYPDLKYIDENGFSTGTRILQEYDDHDKFAEDFWLYQIVIAVSIFYHKSCFDVVGKFDESLIESFDYKWLLKALFLHDYKFQHIPEVLFSFRLHHQQISFEHNEKHLLDVEKIRKEIFQLIQQKRPKRWKLSLPKLVETKVHSEKTSPTQHFPKSEKIVLDPKNEFQCKICEHFGGNPNYFYISPEKNTTTCGHCHTHFTREELERW